MSVFSEVFNALPRQGPGSRADTLQALESVRKHLPDSPRILDVGCGAGIQSLTLARHTGGQVLATDLSASLLEILDSRAREEGLDAQIQTVKASMKDLPFEAGSFDLVWSEGAIYIMGFEAGLRAWRPLLAPGGILGISELSWLEREPPPEAQAFWDADYPGMSDVPTNRRFLDACGYRVVHTHTLSDAGWWTEYLDPMARQIARVRQQYGEDPSATATLDELERELSIHRKYLGSYGYVFYLAQRRE